MRQFDNILVPDLSLPRICRAHDCLADPMPDSLYCARHSAQNARREAQWWNHRARQRRAAEDRFQRIVAPKLRTRLYGIADGETIKFGTAVQPRARLCELQVSSPRELILIGSLACERPVEKAVHEFCRAHRIRGEWFRREGRSLIVERYLEPADTVSLYALLGLRLPDALF